MRDPTSAALIRHRQGDLLGAGKKVTWFRYSFEYLGYSRADPGNFITDAHLADGHTHGVAMAKHRPRLRGFTEVRHLNLAFHLNHTCGYERPRDHHHQERDTYRVATLRSPSGPSSLQRAHHKGNLACETPNDQPRVSPAWPISRSERASMDAGSLPSPERARAAGAASSCVWTARRKFGDKKLEPKVPISRS